MGKKRDRAIADGGGLNIKSQGLLRRLRADASGNTLALVGAALVPLAGMIGSGVDLSRAYMAKNRLQSACDAASLAARRTMTADTLTDAVQAEGRKFFNFNFPQGMYQSAAFTPAITKPQAGKIQVSATTTIPTVVMHMFGVANLPLSVTCEASQNFVNTDIVLVLDTTGSMADKAVSTDSQTKIVALREAVMALYDELAPIQVQLAANNMRLRYGVVAYSSTVNVGKLLYADDHANIADSWTYQTRTPIYSTSSQPNRVGTSMSNSTCNNYRQAKTPSNSYPATEKVVARPGTGTYRPCDVTTITYTTNVTANFSHWFHEPRVLDTSQYKNYARTDVDLPTATPGSGTKAAAWSGCIEERETVDTITASSGYSVPAGALDLNINMVPTTNESRWKPHWPQVEYLRAGAASSDQTYGPVTGFSAQGLDACPSGAERLKAWTRAEMQTYVDGLVAVGGTYHDIGMIWGARLISAAGVFGDSPDTHNGMPVSKHVIFMTDGQLAPQALTYGAYGAEYMDQRVTGGESAPQQFERHRQRFKMICNSARGMNVTIWVVAFAVTADSTLSECAGNANQVSTVANRDALIAKFTEIGKNIGALRLTQ